MLNDWQAAATTSKYTALRPACGPKNWLPLQLFWWATLFFSGLAFSFGGFAFAQGDMTSGEVAGQGIVRHTFLEWELTCGTLPVPGGGATEEVCEIRQDIPSEDPTISTHSLALQIANGGPDAELSLALPFGVFVSEPIALDLPQAPLTVLRLETCMPRGCVATGSIDLDMVEQMRGASSAKLTMFMATGDRVEVTLSLMGFADAFSLLQAKSGDMIDRVNNDSFLTDAGIISTGKQDVPSRAIEEAEELAGQHNEVAPPDRPYTQIGLFKIEENARRALAQIQGVGLNGEIRQSQSKGQKSWRVLVGPAPNLEENRKILVLARSLGYVDAYHVKD